jgi:tetratricopeptide (TPR) repeat protein
MRRTLITLLLFTLTLTLPIMANPEIDRLNREGDAALAAKEYYDAYAWYFEALDLDENHLETLQNLQDVSTQRGDVVGARYYAGRITLLTDANHLEALNDVGFYYYLGDDHEQAESYYLRALAVDANHRRTLNNLGVLRYRQNQYEQAEAYHLRALAVAPEHIPTLYHLARLDTSLERYEQVEQYLHRILAIDANRRGAVLSLGLLYNHQHHYAQAEAYYLQALALKEDQPYLLWILGDFYEKQGDAQQAEVYKMRLAAHNLNFRNLMALGEAAENQGRFAQALDYYIRAVTAPMSEADKHPLFTIPGFIHVSKVLHDDVNWEESSFLITPLPVIVNPEIERLNREGLVALRAEQFTHAKALFLQALALDTNRIATLNSLGHLYRNWYLDTQEQSYYLQAQAYHLQAIDLQPHHYITHERLGYLHVLGSDYEKAEAHYRKALALAPDYEEYYRILRLLGVVYDLQKNYQQAEAYYLRALAIFPDGLEALRALIVLHQGQKNYVQAATYQQQMHDLKPDAAALELLAEAAIQQEQLSLAMRYYSQALSAYQMQGEETDSIVDKIINVSWLISERDATS